MTTIPDATLDFHRDKPLTELEISMDTEEFLRDCSDKQFSMVLIIVGKGKSPQSRQLAKRVVTEVLKTSKLIRKFKTAEPENGGEGAIEVWLKN
jgi:DNA-nicking Smr family endonuclease